MGQADIPENHRLTKKRWEVLDNDEADAIAGFGGVTVEKVRAIEMLVLLKAGMTELRERIHELREDA